MYNNFEILAPAGSMENLTAAVRSGANAVYLGVQTFNARASATNFSFEDLKEAVAYCHARNVKVNVTLNTILYDNELEDFKTTVKEVAKAGVDAVITQDLAAAEIVKNVAPELKLHGSTQMAVHNLEGALVLKKLGFSRVILARELSLKQVKYITENCGIETEVFVHGALCVSLSGQCYASAFLGGRSGNRGRCAGTCRLPMSVCGDLDDNHLSLKDLSALDMVKELKDIGVKCVKIEGRLRTPEYVASAVDQTKKAVDGQDFEKDLLADVFSRSGFTNSFFENSVTKDVFGVRTKEDSQKTKATLPKIRELYRREGQYVPVKFDFVMGEDSSILTLTDGNNTVEYKINEQVSDTENDYSKSLTKALEKLGGTPFYLEDCSYKLLDSKYLPLSFINEARRSLCEQLLELRSEVHSYDVQDFDIEVEKTIKTQPKLIARFETVEQLPSKKLDRFEYIILPLEEYEDVPQRLLDKTVLEIPRALFEGTKTANELIEDAKDLGFDKFCVQNIGHIGMVKENFKISSFTLNVSNSLSAKKYKDLGVDIVTLSPEITVEQIKNIDSRVKTNVLAYGHIPLMLTKACPLQHTRTCANCNGQGFIVDRKGKKLEVRCHGKILGYREIFNPIPVYMGDRQKEVNSDYMTLSFTIETAKRVEDVIDMFLFSRGFDNEFTRGLYYKASI